MNNMIYVSIDAFKLGPMNPDSTHQRLVESRKRRTRVPDAHPKCASSADTINLLVRHSLIPKMDAGERAI